MTNGKKTIKRLRAWAALCLPLAGVLALGGCSHDEEPGGDTAAVEFTTSIAAATRTTSGGDQWLTTDEVGVFMLTGGGAMPGGIVPGADNVKFTPATANTASTNLVPASGTPLYWPNSTDNYDFVAYYPWLAVGTGGINAADYTYPVNVSDQSKELDILYAKTTGKSSGNAVPFTFGHLMAKVRINIINGGGMQESDFAGMTAALNNILTTAVMALTDGTLSGEGNAGAITMRAAAAGSGYEAAFEAIVIPQAAGGAASRYVKFALPGSEARYWNISDADALASGKVYTYNLKISKEKVTLESSSITPWDESDPASTGTAKQYEIQPEANSYMAAPNSIDILIPVSQANRVLTADGLGAATTGLGGVTTDNYTVELVWSDLPVGEAGVIKALGTEEYNGQGYVYVKPGAVGNAVIAIRDKTSNTIKWSWHIWVTNAVTFKTDNVTGLTWMDRNLGAAGTTYDAGGKNGLFYQWGRKDAFPASDGTNNNQTYYTAAGGSTGTTAALATGSYTELPDMVRNPLVFATNDETYYGSLNVAGTANKSWNNSSEKTVYDPCPPGWKMPPYQVGSRNSWGTFTDSDNSEWTFASYIGTNKGALFDGVNGTSSLGHFYPAAGLRYTYAGAIGGVGSSGYCWSYTADFTNSVRILDFKAANVYPNGTASRSYGFSVRCVAE